MNNAALTALFLCYLVTCVSGRCIYILSSSYWEQIGMDIMCTGHRLRLPSVIAIVLVN